MTDTPPAIDYREVSIKRLVPNAWNPNHMEAKFFESLVAAIKVHGVQQPILVRAKGRNKLEIIDGENRYRAAILANVETIGVVVVNMEDIEAKIATLAMNNLRGDSVPLALAKIIVDLQEAEYSDADIAFMTGVGEDEQSVALALLDVPEVHPEDVNITVPKDETPTELTFLLMPHEKKSFTSAMTRAVKMVGAHAHALVGGEVKDYNKAMKEAYDLTGMKLRSVGLSTICEAFLMMDDKTKRRAVAKVKARLESRKP